MAGSGIDFILSEPGPIKTRFRINARKAFLKYVKPEESLYREKYRGWAERVESEERKSPTFTLPAAAVLEKVIKAVEGRRPRTRYGVTVPTHVFWVLRCLLPRRWLDRLLAKAV